MSGNDGEIRSAYPDSRDIARRIKAKSLHLKEKGNSISLISLGEGYSTKEPESHGEHGEVIETQTGG